MENYGFENIRVLVGDPNREVRDGIRGGLYGQGFRYIMVTDRMSMVETAVATNKVDLMICDTELPDGDLYDLVHKIRHHELGDNPFIVVTALITAPTPQTVKKIFGAGCDDLIPKPISTGLLFERVLNLARNRKPFVVTSDYIGPNRRAKPRPGTQQIPEIDVPNPLNAKATDDTSAEGLQAEIDRVANVLNEQKMERHAYQINFLVERIVPLYQDGTADDSIVQHLDRLLYVSEDISRRLEGTRYHHVGELCQSMVNVVRAVRQVPLSPDRKDIALMPALAQAVKCAFRPQADVVALSRDISATVERRTATDTHRQVA
ncbi:MAG: response regulator [Proteobacteria bacterium]|nr:response regulator [Pseudomonadota bacterium]